MNTDRPTPETDEAIKKAILNEDEDHERLAAVSRKLERERGDLAAALQKVCQQRDAWAMRCDKLGVTAMREAIKAAHEALSYVSNFEECRIFCADSMDIDSHAAPMCEAALTKLQPFLQ